MYYSLVPSFCSPLSFVLFHWSLTFLATTTHSFFPSVHPLPPAWMQEFKELQECGKGASEERMVFLQALIQLCDKVTNIKASKRNGKQHGKMGSTSRLQPRTANTRFYDALTREATLRDVKLSQVACGLESTQRLLTSSNRTKLLRHMPQQWICPRLPNTSTMPTLLNLEPLPPPQRWKKNRALPMNPRYQKSFSK
jgi:hypothetical protein